MNKWLFLLWMLFPVLANAQMPVREEPRHKPVFENQYLRVLDARLVPGDTTFYHAHELPSIYTAISLVNLIGQVWQGKPGPWVPPVPGQIWYVDHTKTPVTHRLWNIDTTALRILDTEILGSTGENPKPVDGLPGVEPLLDNGQVRAYQISVGAGQRLELPADALPALVIALTPENSMLLKGWRKGGKKKWLEQGDFAWCDRNGKLQLFNKGKQAVALAFYQWK